eukprot:jgi/Mesen1/3364/ME000191S02498
MSRRKKVRGEDDVFGDAFFNSLSVANLRQVFAGMVGIDLPITRAQIIQCQQEEWPSALKGLFDSCKIYISCPLHSV